MEEKMDVTIVIPTKNGGERLKEVLNSIFKQETDYEYEVVCIDSGSTDTTLSTIAQFPCKKIEIKPEEFGHGRTRNQGAENGTGTFIVFLTQDAVPATKRWLQNLIDAMGQDLEIAGGFGKHLPYHTCNPFDQRNLKAHFDQFGDKNTIFKIEDWDRYKREESYMHKLAFFSDNNACLRREIWEKYPYPDVDFAEDQIWMRQMMEKGYKKVYCPDAPVYHSHNYTFNQQKKRCFHEYRGLYRIHGYQIAKSFKSLPYLWIKFVFVDAKYVRHLNRKKREKIQWIWYSMWQNYCRVYCGYLGGKYDSFSEKKKRRLDQKMKG